MISLRSTVPFRSSITHPMSICIYVSEENKQTLDNWWQGVVLSTLFSSLTGPFSFEREPWMKFPSWFSLSNGRAMSRCYLIRIRMYSKTDIVRSSTKCSNVCLFFLWDDEWRASERATCIESKNNNRNVLSKIFRILLSSSSSLRFHSIRSITSRLFSSLLLLSFLFDAMRLVVLNFCGQAYRSRQKKKTHDDDFCCAYM